MGNFTEQLEDEMSLRGLTYETKRTYHCCVRSFIRYFTKAADKLSLKDVKTFQLYLAKEKKAAWATYNQHIFAIRFFFKNVLRKKWNPELIPFQKIRKRLPTFLSRQEVERLLNAITNPKHLAICVMLYSTGLRVSEVANLKPADIESDHMLIRVNQGKGKKDRYVVLSPYLLSLLRSYWKAYWSGRKEKPIFLFPGINLKKPMSRKGLLFVIKKCAVKAGLNPNKVSGRILRHTFSTHSLENGTNIRVIQALLGHRSISTTSIYAHVAADYLRATPTPIDILLKNKTKKEEGAAHE